MKTLTLGKEVVNKVISHCLSVYPDEACGILAGSGGRVSKVYTMTNTEPSGVSYLMDPGEQFIAMKEMRAGGLEMIAIYHSHPCSPPYPSHRDIELAFYTEPIYLIVGLLDKEKPDLRAYSIADGAVSEVSVIKLPHTL